MRERSRRAAPAPGDLGRLDRGGTCDLGVAVLVCCPEGAADSASSCAADTGDRNSSSSRSTSSWSVRCCARSDASAEPDDAGASRRTEDLSAASRGQR